MNLHDELAQLCRTLGEPSRDLAVLGEGNASARIDDATLLVTASGSELARVSVEQLVEVHLDRALDLAADAAGATEIRPDTMAGLAVAGAPGAGRIPSIETLLHAVVVQRTGARYVGHTHPTSVLGLVCGGRAREHFAGRIFPDEVVVCGREYLVVEYAAPGPALAAALAESLDRHHGQVGEWPRAIVLEHHGLLALGATATEVVAVTTMVDKSARVRAGALAVGELRTLPPTAVAALADRADEAHRRRLLVAGD